LSYLRVSLTERCNLRCGYCYGTGDETSCGGEYLDNDQVVRLIRSFARIGFDKIRFTGGECLLRRGIAELVAETAATEGIELVGMTTNGLLLRPLLPRLIEAGLNRLNVSLDTLDPRKFKEISGVDGFDLVFGAITDAVESGAFRRVKVNTVVMRGINDDDVSPLAEWALERDIDLRFIEFMPTSDSNWAENRFISEMEIRKRVDLPLEPVDTVERSHGPASSYHVPGRPGRISFISAVSRSFCSACNRLRVTSRGDLYGCLFQSQNVNVRRFLQEPGGDRRLDEYLTALFQSRDFRREPTEQSITSFEPFMRGLGG
jgi:cyclic pyranopterin phosphate synthase